MGGGWPEMKDYTHPIKTRGGFPDHFFAKRSANVMNDRPKIGSGKRFAALKAKLGRRGDVQNPGALAASIGRKKYGKKKFQALAAKGRKG